MVGHGLLQRISRSTHLSIYEQPSQTGVMALFREDLPTLHVIDETKTRHISHYNYDSPIKTSYNVSNIVDDGFMI